MMYTAAQSHLIVDEYFLIPGGIGIVVTAILYGTITKWGFFKHKWITVKWILTVLLIAIAGIVQLIMFVYIITISVVKPWKKVFNGAGHSQKQS